MDLNDNGVSVVIPVYNEAENLPELLPRLEAAMQGLARPYEILFVDDGSSDRSYEILKEAVRKFACLKVIRLSRNFGQHAAIFAGFEKCQGEIAVTLDADLQNPPEEIPKLLRKMEEGYEVVGGYRENRQDSILRKIPSFFVARLTSRMVKVRLKDYGCMLRAYRRDVVRSMLASGEASTYIPALANFYASSVAEIPVRHNPRKKGSSKYSLLKLLHLNFDLMTSFSLLPIQIVGLSGVGIALSGLAFSVFLLIMRLVKGPEWAVQGVFTLFGILFFFVGLQVLAIGLIGEYVGRIYQEVRQRSRYRILDILTSDQAGRAAGKKP